MISERVRAGRLLYMGRPLATEKADILEIPGIYIYIHMYIRYIYIYIYLYIYIYIYIYIYLSISG